MAFGSVRQACISRRKLLPPLPSGFVYRNKKLPALPAYRRNWEKNLENLRKCRYYSIDIELDRRQGIDEEVYEVARLWQ